MASVMHGVEQEWDEHRWDVVVVGTGMGGGALGHALATRGRRVLFLEQGRDTLDAINDASGEMEVAADRLRFGRWPDQVQWQVDGRAYHRFISLGCGIGGSTPFYGGALERFDRRDLEPDDAHPAGPWPISYDTLAPFYAEAEALLGVRGTRDPLGDADAPACPRAPPPSGPDAVLFGDMARAGLHPYRLHVGIAYRPGCTECIGRVCPTGCKSDAANRFVLPAIAGGRATLRGGCEVLRVESQAGRATALIYRRDGRLYRVSAPILVLAAGTLRTPALLLASATPEHPAGLANGSGLVGRNLMFHASDWLAVWPSRKNAAPGPSKTISLRDFYRVEGARGGALQSVGLPAGYGNILLHLYDRFDRSRWRWLKPLRPWLRVPARVAARLFGQATLFALIVEDLPYPDNRVELDAEAPGRIKVTYRIPKELRERVAAGRRAIGARLRNRHFWLKPDVVLDDGHPSGTCRFGHDPARSVLDPDCRAHEIDNLYVVDGSFMPSSGGTNPSLTIAANALRVAARIDERLRTPTPDAVCAGGDA
jgi:choline dehydrogenase-like flavoprotein